MRRSRTTRSRLEQRLEEVLPGVVPPAGLLMRLAEVLGSEPVVLATATGPSGLFGIEEWAREVGPVPTRLNRPTLPAPRAEG